MFSFSSVYSAYVSSGFFLNYYFVDTVEYMNTILWKIVNVSFYKLLRIKQLVAHFGRNGYSASVSAIVGLQVGYQTVCAG